MAQEPQKNLATLAPEKWQKMLATLLSLSRTALAAKEQQRPAKAA
jgi:hypothetical protein